MEYHIYTHKSPVTLESGAVLPEVRIQYSTSGIRNADEDNIIWVCHALTANSDVESWWPGLVGTDYLYNPQEHFIVCANILSSCYGTTGPTETNPETNKPYFLSFPVVTIRDMVTIHDILREHLEIKKIHTLIGGSLGGQQAMEWAIQQPHLFQHLILLSTNAFHSPWGIAFNESQRMAIDMDPTWKNPSLDAGREGLKTARSIAMLSYRSYETYVETQREEDSSKTDDYRAITYQHYQGDKLVKRFNCHSYWYLSKAMDSHHVGRNRESAAAALASIRSKTLVIGISSDILFPVCEQEYVAKHISGAQYVCIDSLYGHDGFLTETDKLDVVIRNFYLE
ncbi:homoserine O-acetyltransferase family protein [Cytophaga hutchinsonii]|uniref:Homoserine O-acetyltransferase n=1 Tax=Cytophaga hutchinsonii (strain ATCC 33406 / DSM 1761 / CIP 103989 / NBRC 15051 / NCIMB 9469 / D465) TaxID=269798 RepID=A0A6N4SMF0_CYTH3|nr:homoserine O-acetyltransferase [Cytophaga hutchinsonii]ABG57429.1 homoserine O-acetyltransferase [Cytophaga hutchinsonii ATCC 33406]SFX98013.1 homoserine O-acetyltransferase [Cytophaga hutchinsonii ATCC 33406]